jgi:hypothetical protein
MTTIHCGTKHSGKSSDCNRVCWNARTRCKSASDCKIAESSWVS